MPTKKILIADYDVKALESLEELFSPFDVETLKAVDGQTAYEKYRNEKPDLIILEAMLPKIHGFDLTSKISKETDGKLPIIIVTGLYKGAQYKNEALRTFGAADYFEKPYDRKRLLETAMRFLKKDAEIDGDLPSPAEVISILQENLEARSGSQPD